MSRIGQYPVDHAGRMVVYLDRPYNEFTWKDIEEFEATMTFSHMINGNFVRFILKDENGKPWSMMEQCIDDFVFRSNRGSVSGKWIVCKRGANYGLLLIK